MQRCRDFFLGMVAVGVLGFSAYWLIKDVRSTYAKSKREPAPVVLPTEAEGWYPVPGQPLFAWDKEGDTAGWVLEADQPLELSRIAPAYLAPYRDPDQEPTEPKPPAQDEDAEGVVPTGSLTVSTEHLSGQDNAGNLRVPVRFPDAATLYRKARPLSGVRYIAYDVFVPANVKGYVGCLFFLQDKDGLWYQARAKQRLLPGRWTTVAADIRGGSPDVTPLGHLGQWEENQASQVRTIGITFYGDEKYEGFVHVDNFRGWMRADKFRQRVAKLSGDAAKDQLELSAEEREKLLKLAEQAGQEQSEPLAVLNLRTEPPAPAGSDSPPAVGLYETLTVRFELNRQIYNPFDVQHADIRAFVTAPSGKTMTVYGFWYQDFERNERYDHDELAPLGRPEWRVRITPSEVGEHKYKLEVQLKGEEPLETPEFTFAATPSREHGFVRVSLKDPSYFEFDDGSFFYPVGHNVHTPVDLRCWQLALNKPHPLARGLKLYESIFPRMAAAGENVAEVWMAAWWVGLEWTRRWRHYHGAGRYSLENAWKLDRLLDNARRHGVRVHLVIDNHGKLSEFVDPEWDDNPFNKASDPDGNVEHPGEYFTDPRTREMHKQRLRYIAARWGGDPTVMGWELVSEFNLVGNGQRGPRGNPIGKGDYNYYKTPPARAWVREMLEALRSYDPYKRPATNHFSGDFNVVDRELAMTPAFDYIVGDGYRDQPGWTAMAQGWFRTFGYARKPYWVTEFGGYWNASSPARLEADLHTGLWSTWMTNAGATPLFWWYDFVDQANHYTHYRAFTRFIQGEDRRGQNGFPEEVRFTSARDNLDGMQYRWSEGVYAWVFNQQSMAHMPDKKQDLPRHEGLTALVPGLTEGPYSIEYWDTYEGKVLLKEQQELQPGQQLNLRFPAFKGDVAVKARRKPLPSEGYPPSHTETERAKTPGFGPGLPEEGTSQPARSQAPEKVNER